MTAIYKEAGFPADYREAEVRQIMNAVYKLRSIAITGLAGMGKSNVVRFIVSHPQVRSRYLQERADDFAFVHIDCAGLVGSDATEILGEIAAQLHYQGLSASPTQSPPFPRSMRRILREQLLSVKSELNLALFLDYFDEPAAELDKAFFNYLFYLRNARPQGNLAYVFATRRPMGHLHELQELLDDGCAVGPLSYKDALGSIQRDEARLGCTFEAAQRDRLIACTGGHPGFLKNTSELLVSGQVDTTLLGEAMARQLLQSAKIRNLCEELWNDLKPAEGRILLNTVRGIPLSEPVDSAHVAYLLHSGVLIRKQDGPGVAIFCPLFKVFVHDQSAVASQVCITAAFPNQARIATAGGEEQIALSPKLFALLLALTEARGQVLPADELISSIYGREAVDVSQAALSQLDKRLRGALDPHVQRMVNDPGYTCVETIRDVGYRLNA